MKIIYFYIAFLLPLTLHAQRMISGVVTDAANGDTLIGASVVQKGTTNGTLTDLDGKYSITVSSNATALVFAYVGYSTLEIPLGKSNTIHATLKVEQTLMEVMVVGCRACSKKVLGFSAEALQFRRGMPKSKQKKVQDTIFNTNSNEDYKYIVENSFQKAKDEPRSTFSIDVDKASYSNVRRFIEQEGKIPHADAVEMEELINYFDYDYPQPSNSDPLTISTELAACPWNLQHYILNIGMKGKEYALENLPPSNFVFLIDVSGSMSDENKLPLVKKAFEILVEKLRPKDRIAIVVYAGAAGLVLPSTSGADKETILKSLQNLKAGGSTAGGEGIQLAYKVAKENWMEHGNNRVILATDGDFNVGISSERDLTQLIENQRKTGIFLSVLGFGMGNLKDNTLETLADKGNGNYAYIDDLSEAKRVLGSELTGTLFTIAKDVKLQIEFNPTLVASHRLIGYENRMLEHEDFNDDAKDAGELGAGQTVTALYEIIPVGAPQSDDKRSVEPLKYQEMKPTVHAKNEKEWATIQFRYKEPKSHKSRRVEKTMLGKPKKWTEASDNFRFSAAVASYGMLLRDSQYKGNVSYEMVIEWATAAKGTDAKNYRAEFIEMVRKTLKIKKL
jgi:Ca-activated chloride channel homolog